MLLALVVAVLLLVTCWLYPTVAAVSAVCVRKAIGLLPEVSWAEVAGLARFNPRPELWHLAKTGDPYSSIHSPFTGTSDRVHGRGIFDSNCSKCHGPEARGGLGPALVGRPLSHGDSDWAVYRTILSGVPGTAMQGGVVSRQDAWRVIAYLRAIQASAGAVRASAADSGRVTLAAAPDVSAAALLTSADEAGKWLLPGGSYNGQRFSRDTQINLTNISRLAVQWIHQFPSASAPSESAPIVAGDYLYTTVPPGTVYALDAKSGAQVWQYTRTIPADVHVCCVATNRGVAVLGQRVYFGTLDAHLVALDATSGQVLWDQVVTPYGDGYSITSSPLPVGNLIITGIAGAEYPTRGFISAYDAATGALRWRFNTIPEPGEPGHETWGSGDSWKTGGASTWGTGVYDPELGLLYWGVGTPAPDFNASARPGDNLYSSSVVALNVATGKLAWYFQFLPGEDHDWDSTQTPTLLDIKSGAVAEKLLAVANRGGFYYVLDRSTGRFIRGAPFVKQTWAVKLSASGRPIRTPNSSPSVQGTYVVPSVNGASNWWPTSYSPVTGLHYVNVEEGGGLYFTNGPGSPRPGRMYIGGTATYGDSFLDLVKAIDPATATVRWERRNSTVTSAPRGGLLSTAGGLLFGSDGSVFYALDALSGRQLWSFDAGGHISAPPVTYQIGGKQVVAVVAGQDLITFALPGS
ncbi:MAG: PQQ-binding-like beta-propeller repeat protein [Steroidobacterales bacterium]|jgi:alcohol dehydrogenase (cytochrome c)